MALLAYNKTTSPLTMAAGSPAPMLSASPLLGKRGPAKNVTSELRSVLPAGFAAIQVQITAGLLDVEWTDEPEYPTPGILHPTVMQSYTTASRPLASTSDDATIIFNLDTNVTNIARGGAWYDPAGFLA